VLSSEGQRGSSNEDSTDAGQKDIGTIKVRGEAEFAAQTAKPEDHAVGPGVSDTMHKQGCQEDHHEEATHPFDGLHAHIFDIQPILLVKAVGVLDARPVPPLGIHCLGLCGGTDRDVGEQDQIAVVVWVVGNQRPQQLLGVGQADHQPAQPDVHPAHLAGVGEGDTKLEGQGHGGGQIVQQLHLPTVEPLIVDLDCAIVASTNGEMRVHQADLAEDLLVIQTCVRHKVQLDVWKQSARDPNGALDLPVLTDKVGCLVGEPVGVGDYRLGQVDYGRGDRRSPGSVASSAPSVGAACSS